MAFLKSLAPVMALSLCLTNVIVMPGQALAGEMTEYEVKAAFLVNFAKFIEWPASSFADPAAPFVIGVLGDDPFGPDLDSAIKSKLAGARPIVAKHLSWRDDLSHLQMLFITSSEKRHLKDILGSLDTSSVLTVSDIDTFISAGGLIAFVRENNRIRFQVNADSARRHGLKVSSKLLSLATIVN